MRNREVSGRVGRNRLEFLTNNVFGTQFLTP